MSIEEFLSDCSIIESSDVICNEGNNLAILLSIEFRNGESLYSGKLINFKNNRKIWGGVRSPNCVNIVYPWAIKWGPQPGIHCLKVKKINNYNYLEKNKIRIYC